MNPAKLSSLIRFHLSEMGARNAQHEFEHLARHVARARIASNILPATGPVGSGGDGGRDFESFKTRHASPAPPGNRFAALSSGARRLVFDCSLEKAIEAKIRADVRTHLARGDVDEIVYFCEANLPIAKRLKLIKWAKDGGLELQIFDGNAIAEWLAEPDIFWIAQEYLHLPSEVAPFAQLEEGYVDHRRKWQDRTPVPFSRAHFLEVKAGLRTATFDEAARPDLRFWLDKMAVFLTGPTQRALARDAMYEIAVGNLRGKGHMTPAAELVVDYFSDVTDHLGIGELTDAACLSTYGFGGFGLGQYDVDPHELFARRTTLVGIVEGCLAEPGIGPGRRSGLLRIRGDLEMTPSDPTVERDLERAFGFWNEMLDHAAEAPLFPIEEFSDFLTRILVQLGKNGGLLALASRADDLVEKRAGSAAAGEKAVDRAFGLLDRGDTTAAIRELHKAKTKWFLGEQLAGALRILLSLADQYGGLGLAYAAKYQALAAAFIARYEKPNRVGNLLPLAMLEVLDAEDVAGNSLGFMQLVPMMMATHLEHDPHPMDLAEHPRVQDNLNQLAALLGLLKRGSAVARECIDPLAAEWPPAIREPIWSGAESRAGFWNRGSWDSVWTDLEGAMLDRPFGDLGPTRRVRWSALGIDWRCDFANRYATTPGAEQLVAELQLAACAMADRDLGIVPCSVTIKLEFDESRDRLTFEIIDREACEIAVTLPTVDRNEDHCIDTIVLFTAIVHSCTVFLDEELMKSMDASIFEPVFVGRPYAEFYRDFVSEAAFAEDVRAEAGELDPDRHFRSRAGTRVRWFDGPGPTYEPGTAKLDISVRYERALTPVRFTLERLKADTVAMRPFRAIREKGAKDWEILSIVSNMAMNHRLVERGVPEERMRDVMLQMANTPEAEEDALDPGIFSPETIKIHSDMYLAAFLDGRQLRAPPFLSFEGLERFLIARYRLRDDDAEHPDIFGWSDGSEGNHRC